MGGHENQHERQESDYERRVQLVKLGQLDVLLWGSQSWLSAWPGRPPKVMKTRRF
jgi:hypothetical protein